MIDEELPPAPARVATVAVAAVVFVAITVMLALVETGFAIHLSRVPDDIRTTTSQTGILLSGKGELYYYEHDIVVLLVGLIYLVLMVRSVPRLWRGRSDGRTVALILGGTLAVGCLAFQALSDGSIAVATTVDDIRNTTLPVTTGTTSRFSDAYAVLEQQSTPGWIQHVVTIAIVAIPLAALCFAALVVSPPSTEYFRAMRRSGTY